MIRRQIFFGLTIVLLTVVVVLLLRGRKAEKEQAAQNLKAGQVREAPSSPTRVLAPRDVALVAAEVSFAPTPAPPDGGDGGEATLTARHALTVRNGGGVAYGGLRLRLEYVGKSGEVLEDRIQAVEGALPPGESLRIEDVAVTGVPAGAVGCRASIVSADFPID
ncbi:MAG: hypothetical protein LBT74_13270 [Acidobacteriota bacterium]|jgi:hypothetical protein|nr:hypothetical protein [Acidobacteriota bacterium]